MKPYQRLRKLAVTKKSNGFDDGAMDLLAAGVVLIDPDWTIEAVNLAGETLLDVSLRRALGEPIYGLIDLSEQWESILEQAQTEDYPMVQRGLCLKLRSGREQTVDLTVSPVHRGPTPHLLLEITPIDRMNAISDTEDLWQAQDSLRQIIKGLAHEVKNPLGGIRGAAQLLSKELPSGSLSEYTDIIMEEADRLRGLVDRMLGPKERLDKRLINIHEVTERVIQLMEAETQGQLGIVRDYDPSLPEFEADPDQITQVLLNIARNARQAAGSHARITFQTRAWRQHTLGGQRHKLVCALSIIDNGPGVPSNVLPRLFLPMVTGRANGTGLGLSIAQMIANRHGGLIQCQSEPGATNFTVLLPMET